MLTSVVKLTAFLKFSFTKFVGIGILSDDYY